MVVWREMQALILRLVPCIQVSSDVIDVKHRFGKRGKVHSVLSIPRCRGGKLECRRKVGFRCGNHHGPKEAAAMWWGELENLSGREKTGVKFEEAEGELGETK